MLLNVLFKNNPPLKINVDPNITVLELKKKIADCFHITDTGFHFYYGNEIIDNSKNNMTLKELNIRSIIRLPVYYNPGGCMDNIKEEIDLNIGFDMNLIKRNELYVNLIHFDFNYNKC